MCEAHSAAGCGLRAATGPRRGGAKKFIVAVQRSLLPLCGARRNEFLV